MADADRTALRIIEEATFGDTPDGSLLAKSTVEVLVADNSYNDTVEDLSVFKAGQTILVSGCSETAANGYKTVVTAPDRPAGVITADVSIAALTADDSFNDPADKLLLNFVVGQKILVSGFSEPGNNGIFHVATVAADGTKITVEENLTDDPAADAVTILSYSTITVLETLTNDPAADPVTILTAYEELRHTGESLKQETASQESAEIRDDRQVVDVKRASVNANGDINTELSYEAYDKLIAAALMSAGWSTEVASTEVTYAAVAATNKLTDSGNAFITDGFLANQWVEVRGFTLAANNGYFKIVSVAAGDLVLEGGTLAEEVAGDSVTITMGRQVVNGVAPRSFSIEREYAELTEELTLYNGMMVNQLVLNIVAEQILTGVFSFMGKTGDSITASTGTGTPKVAPTKAVMNAVEDILSILENMTDTEANSLTLTINNNLRNRSIIGELGPIDIGAGKIGVSGTVQMYYESKAIMDKYLDQDETSLAFIIEDDAGNAYIIDLPRVKYTSGQRVAGGQNSDIIADMAFSAYRDATEDVTIRIARFDA